MANEFFEVLSFKKCEYFIFIDKKSRINVGNMKLFYNFALEK